MTSNGRDSLLLCSLHTYMFYCSISLLPMPMKWLHSKRIWVQSLVGMQVLFSCHVQDDTGGSICIFLSSGYWQFFAWRWSSWGMTWTTHLCKVLNFKNEWSCTSTRRPTLMLHCACILIVVPVHKVSSQKVSHSLFRIWKQSKQWTNVHWTKQAAAGVSAAVLTVGAYLGGFMKHKFRVLDKALECNHYINHLIRVLRISTATCITRPSAADIRYIHKSSIHSLYDNQAFFCFFITAYPRKCSSHQLHC